ncbi:MAG: Flp family type IVb pilin [Gemmatimonadota bacterium]|nr:Flp family type IVb pilin [Gemmatimonadota bacterium]MDQ8167889.1 Flp family type IVb pilin [Gemmatimonadota bacterium]
MQIKTTLKRFLADESGASIAEYALLIGLVVVAGVAAFAVFGPKLNAAMVSAGSALDQNP